MLLGWWYGVTVDGVRRFRSKTLHWLWIPALVGCVWGRFLTELDRIGRFLPVSVRFGAFQFVSTATTFSVRLVQP